MIRLQRVTFLALHDYLGLTTELTRPADIIPPLPTGERPQATSVRHSKSHRADTGPSSMRTSIEALNNGEENFQTVRTSQSVLDLSFTSPSSDALQTSSTTDPKVLETPVMNGESTASSVSTGRKRPTHFSGQRSMSVVESHRLIPDFEEAAARARVKNSLDTTFFEKHKITYPNVPSNRTPTTNFLSRQISLPDVKISSIFFVLRSTRFV